ncbi:MAG: molybdate ABC transporter substrate-binding protein [Nitrospirota bacterium]
MIVPIRIAASALVFLCVGLFCRLELARAELLVIAASPTVKVPLEALGNAFEAQFPGTRVRLHVEPALELRQTIAGMQNNLMVNIHRGRGLIHLIAPGGDELLTRLESKNYIRPGSRRPYAVQPLVLVVPESVVEAPMTFEALAQGERLRIVIADPAVTILGQKSRALLQSLGLWQAVNGRLTLAADARGVIDHLMRGEADVGILFGPEAVREQQRIRIAAVANHGQTEAVVYSLAMDAECPDRALAQRFIEFTQGREAQAALRSLGYLSPVEALNGKAPEAMTAGR